MKNQPSEGIRNPELVEAMRAMLHHDSEKTRGHMAEVLMDAQLLSPIQQQTLLTEKEGPSVSLKKSRIRKEINIIWRLPIWMSMPNGMKMRHMIGH